ERVQRQVRGRAVGNRRHLCQVVAFQVQAPNSLTRRVEEENQLRRRIQGNRRATDDPVAPCPRGGENGIIGRAVGGDDFHGIVGLRGAAGRVENFLAP